MYISLFALVLQVATLFAAPQEEEITHLPGWSPRPFPSKHYSGFVDSNSDGSIQMHYWFVECETNPSEAPLMLWFNGGPGASSLYGLLIELGPFLLSDLSYLGKEYEETQIPQLIYNPNGWQKSANVLALSMPPPVGFSYCTPPGPSAQGNDCGAWNDTSTADVTFYALKSFLMKFPEYLPNEMFVSGESYAGVYVPMLVQRILAYNEELSNGNGKRTSSVSMTSSSSSTTGSELTTPMNLKGFAVGDACTPPEICGSKHHGPYFNLEFMYGKAAISNKAYEVVQGSCSTEELVQGGDAMSPACSDSVNAALAEVGPYWVYAFYDDCYYENDIRRKLTSSSAAVEVSASGAERPYYGPPIGMPGTKKRVPTAPAKGHPKGLVIPNGYACGGPAAQMEWLSLDVVKDALHVPREANFFQCDNGGDFTYTLTEDDVIAFYKEIITNNTLRVLVYNGDTDPGVSVFQAQNWTRNMGFSEEQSWRAWTTDSCQRMGGYVTRYENNFDFLTIRGAGHMVPEMKPEVSLEFITRWMRGEEYQFYDPECTAPPPQAAVTVGAEVADADADEETLERMLKDEQAAWAAREAELQGMLKKARSARM